MKGVEALTCRDSTHPIGTRAAQQRSGSLLLDEVGQYSAVSMHQDEG